WAVSRVHPSTIQLSMQLKTPYERALAICASFGALGLSSLFISSITNTMADTSRKLQRKNQLLHSVREYCSAHFISASHVPWTCYGGIIDGVMMAFGVLSGFRIADVHAYAMVSSAYRNS
ncbi:eag, partial [Symbiodinium sp. CCMP2592]